MPSTLSKNVFPSEKKEKSARKDKRPLASTPMDLIRKLYAIEKKIKEFPPDKILEYRLKYSAPILESFKIWLEIQQNKVLPKSLLGKAITYGLNQWDKLIEFSKNPLLPIDNNYLESQIRNFAIGRKNWLFSLSEKGAHSSATLYSLIASAKANNLDSFKYLHLIFKELPKCETLQDFENLLPYNIKEHFKV